MKYIIFTKKKWDQKNYLKLKKNIFVLDKINIKKINLIKPNIIFFIHWSEIIKKSIFKKYLCIQFHSSNLPKGKGGSPIQNQILLNKKNTKISAFKVTKGLDAGPICIQDTLSLKGSAHQIYKQMEFKCIKMIKKIIKTKKLKFKRQKGEPSFFKRRKASESKINFNKTNSILKLYNFLRMLDAPGYPNAFIKSHNFKLIFNEIKKNRNKIFAKIEIIKK